MDEQAPPSRRDLSIDAVRGAVMLLMVVDHVRDFLTSTPFNATDPDRTNTALFFTRFVTHYCAPVFMLLAGAGVGISRARGRSLGELTRFLLSRGLWLVFLELTWVRFGWMFDLQYLRSPAQVIWALGWCMVLLATLVHLSPLVLVIFGVALIAGHNLLDTAAPEQLGTFAWMWKILHAGGAIELAPGHSLRIAYPLVPWIGVMAVGYCMGLAWSRLGRRRLFALGAGLTGLFFAIRGFFSYGDPHAFVARSGMRTVFAFLDCAKYPPSLDYLLMTLGPALLVLGVLRDRPLVNKLGVTLVMFGRVPLFFYLLHLPLAHVLALPFRYAQGLPLSSGSFGGGLHEPLTVVYLVTVVVIAILWWPCKRWAALKAERRDAWLSYL